MAEIFPEVLQAVAGDNYTVYAYMLDGTIKLYDASELIKKGGVFAPLRDKSVFENALTVLNGTVAWSLDGSRDEASCIDVDPFVIAECKTVSDPLDKAV